MQGPNQQQKECTKSPSITENDIDSFRSSNTLSEAQTKQSSSVVKDKNKYWQDLISQFHLANIKVQNQQNSINFINRILSMVNSIRQQQPDLCTKKYYIKDLIKILFNKFSPELAENTYGSSKHLEKIKKINVKAFPKTTKEMLQSLLYFMFQQISLLGFQQIFLAFQFMLMYNINFSRTISIFLHYIVELNIGDKITVQLKQIFKMCQLILCQIQQQLQSLSKQRLKLFASVFMFVLFFLSDHQQLNQILSGTNFHIILQLVQIEQVLVPKDRQFLFKAIVQTYLSYGHQSLRKLIYFMIDFNLTHTMVLHVWSFLNYDCFPKISFQSLQRTQQVLKKLQMERSVEQLSGRKGLWFEQKVPDRRQKLIIKIIIRHPWQLDPNQQYVILRMNMQTGIIKVGIRRVESYSEGKKTLRNQVYYKKEGRPNFRSEDQEKSLYEPDCCILELKMQVGGQRTIKIDFIDSYSQESLECQIKPGILGRVQKISLGVRKTQQLESGIYRLIQWKTVVGSDSFNIIEKIEKRRNKQKDKELDLPTKIAGIKYKRVIRELKIKKKLMAYLLNLVENRERISQGSFLKFLQIFSRFISELSFNGEDWSMFSFLFQFCIAKKLAFEELHILLGSRKAQTIQSGAVWKIIKALIRSSINVNKQECRQTIQNIKKLAIVHAKGHKVKEEGEMEVISIVKSLNFLLWSIIQDEGIENQAIVPIFQTIFKNYNTVTVSNESNTTFFTKIFEKIRVYQYQIISCLGGWVKKIISESELSLSNVIQFVIIFARLVLIILANLSLNCQIYVESCVLSAVQQCYQIMCCLNQKLENYVGLVSQQHQNNLCLVLSQIYNMLPELYFFSIFKMEQREKKKVKEQKKMKFVYNAYKAQISKSEEPNRFYKLMRRMYEICFQIGSNLMSSQKNGFFTYFFYAYKFLQQQKDLFCWGNEQANNEGELTERDKIGMYEIYMACFTFILGGKKKGAKLKLNFDQENKIELCHKLIQLCLPIYSFEISLQSKIFCYIIDLYTKMNIMDQLQLHIFSNLSQKDICALYKTMHQINKGENMKDVMKLMIKIANSKDTPIQLKDLPFNRTMMSPDLSKLYGWYQIYNEVKFLLYHFEQDSVLSSNDPISNINIEDGSQLQKLLVKKMKDIRDKLNGDKDYGNLKFIINNFLNTDGRSNESKDKDKDAIKNSAYFLPFLQFLANQCKEINNHFSWKQQKRGKKGEFFIPVFKENYFFTESSLIPMKGVTKIAQRVIVSNSQYYYEMHSSIAKQKVINFEAYYKMIGILSLEQKLDMPKKLERKYCSYGEYILDDWLNAQNVKVMLKKDPLFILNNLINGQKPKLFQSKQIQSHRFFALIIAKNFLNMNKNPYFKIMQQVESKGKKIAPQNSNKKSKVTILQCYLVTKSKVYQGKVYIDDNEINFEQNNFIDEQIYKRLFVNNSQKRTYQQISVSRKFIKIVIQNVDNVQRKKYLQKFPSLEIFQSNLSYFFAFQSREYPQKFLEKAELTHRSEKEEGQILKEFKKDWEKGWFNNFELLITVNNISGRSFNDVSQYYVFPWILINYSSSMDTCFLKNKKNFRDLSVAIGALNQKKLQTVLNKYSNMYVQNTEFQKPYMFGSFYSNSAIVCNYLLRVNPFTNHHYQLQGGQFDLYDRLFTNIQDQFNSTLNNAMDNKQLVPEFYCAPQFFRNRNGYNFAHSKPSTNKVGLQMRFPSWVVTKTPEQFVFKMRKSLQSQLVTGSIGNWIDLIFGYKSQIQRAADHHNLYVSQLYSKTNEKDQGEDEDEEVKPHMIKQFGQVPKNIFGKKPSLDKKINQEFDNYIDSKFCQMKILMESKESKKSYPLSAFSECLMVISTGKKLIMFDTKDKMQLRQQIEIEEEYKSISIMNIPRTKKVILIGVTINGSSQLRVIEKCQKRLGILSEDQIYKLKYRHIINNEFNRSTLCKTIKNFCIFAEDCQIKLLQISMKDIKKEKSNSFQKIDDQLQYNRLDPINIHKFSITHLQTFKNSSLICSVDQNLVANIFTLLPSFLIRSTFYIQNLGPFENITKIEMHSINIICFLTNRSQLLVYNIYGDLIQRVRIGLDIIDFVFWDNKSSSDILAVDRTGKLYQFDIFDLAVPGKHLAGEKVQLTIFHKKELTQVRRDRYNIIIHRVGKLWEIYLVSSSAVYNIECCTDFTKLLKNRIMLKNCNQNTSFKNAK